MTVSRTLGAALAAAILVFPATAYAAEIYQTVRIPMTDGTELVADVYLPQPLDVPRPVILARSTYGRVGGPVDPLLMLGFAVVAQDVRGMGESEGEKHVFYADGWREGLTDGADTVAWIKAQPWCNGKIGTWGGSALGITQQLLAPVTNDVAAQFIDIAPSSLYHYMFYQGGVFRKALLEGWLPQIGQTHLLEVYHSHPTFDDYWKYFDFASRASDVTAPALFVGAWHDIFNQGTIDAFLARELNGGPGAKGANYLVMRPAAHVEAPSPDYTYNENRWAFPIQNLGAAFYLKHLLGREEPLQNFAKVNYYTMGADTEGAPGNEWRKAEAWPPFDTVATPYYLQADGTLSTDAPGAENASLTYAFDPKNPVPTVGGPNLMIPPGPMDQRPVADRPDVLVFKTAPLDAPLEITGQISARLFVSSDAPDTDFTAKLVDIYPGGDERQILLLDGIRRVKTRNGYDKFAPLLTGPEEIVELEIDLQSISFIFDTGHRIGLHVSSSNSPRFEVNPNTGADFPGADGEARVAQNTVHMSVGSQSAVILPVRPAGH